MKRLLFILLTLVFVSCGNQDPEQMKDKLAGYWEIEKVRLPDGTERTFGMSSTIDFISIVGDSGVRKKVAPQFDGSFLANDSAEKFSIKIEDDSLNLYYITPYDNWKETVLMAQDSVMEVLNMDGKRYRYRKFRSLKVE